MRLLLLLIALYWSPQALSVDLLGRCKALLVPEHTSLDMVFKSSHLYSDEVRPGKWGGQVLVIKRRPILFGWNYGWRKILPNKPDDQGDLRKGVFHMPGGLQKHFSIAGYTKSGVLINSSVYELGDVFSIHIPDLKELNGGLLNLKKQLQELNQPSNILTFYESDTVLPPLEYLRNLAEREALPMGTKGDLFEHDFNFHFLSALATPPVIVKAMSTRARVLLKFLAYAKKHSAQMGAEDFTKVFIEASLPEAVKRLDFTGDYWGLYRRMLTVKTGEMAQTHEHIFIGAASPKFYLKNLIGETVPQPLALKASKLIDQFFKEPDSQSYGIEDLQKAWFGKYSTQLYFFISRHVELLNNLAASRQEDHSYDDDDNFY